MALEGRTSKISGGHLCPWGQGPGEAFEPCCAVPGSPFAPPAGDTPVVEMLQEGQGMPAG